MVSAADVQIVVEVVHIAVVGSRHIEAVVRIEVGVVAFHQIVADVAFQLDVDHIVVVAHNQQRHNCSYLVVAFRSLLYFQARSPSFLLEYLQQPWILEQHS